MTLNNCFSDRSLLEAGVDEAGRGPLVGAVFASAVILPTDFFHPLLNDSKKMTARSRELLREVIEREAVSWSVVSVSAQRIDEINILQATFEAMNGAIDSLAVTPQLLLIDGNRFRTSLDIPYHTIVKGDGIYSSIAAASVLAKSHRDEYMRELDREYPQYGWARNAGYGTKEHMKAIIEHGLSPYHRRTFRNPLSQPR
ncbi:MAG: ribonuclease HII [Rikenellaceae bacterium]